MRPPRRFSTRLISLALLPAMLAGCLSGGDSGDSANNRAVSVTIKEFADTPAATETETPSTATTAEAPAILASIDNWPIINYLSAVSSGEGRYNPYDLSATLAMVGLGAKGSTLDEFSGYFGTDFAKEKWAQSFAALNSQLKADGISVSVTGLGQADYRFQRDYLETLRKSFSASLSAQEFRDGTSGYDVRTRLVLKTTISGSFQPPAGTALQSGRFNDLDGIQYRVPMLQFTGTLRQYSDADLDAVEWTDSSNPLSLLVIMPKDGRFADVRASLQTRLASVKTGLTAQNGVWWLPTFTNGGFGVMPLLARYKAPTAFDKTLADFSSVNGAGFLFLTTPLQVVSTSFEGTVLKFDSWTEFRLEAKEDEPAYLFDNSSSAYQLAAGFGYLGLPDCVNPVVAPDARPFIYVLTHKKTGVLLAIGQKVSLPGEYLGPTRNCVAPTSEPVFTFSAPSFVVTPEPLTFTLEPALTVTP